jgi:hypothetical protein
MQIKLTIRELATVLAALRYWRIDVLEIESGGDLEMVRWGYHSGHPDVFKNETPLSAEDVDELCERLNLAERNPHA